MLGKFCLAAGAIVAQNHGCRGLGPLMPGASCIAGFIALSAVSGAVAAKFGHWLYAWGERKAREEEARLLGRNL